MLYHAILLATGLISLSTATVTVIVDSTITTCPCTTPASIFSSSTGSTTPTPIAHSITKSSSLSPSSATPTCLMLYATCDDNAAIDQCCTGLGYYCSGGKCTDDDIVEGTPDNSPTTTTQQNNAPAGGSTTTAPLAAVSTCAMLNQSCDDNAEVDQCCTDLGYYCSSGSCTDDDQVENSA